MISDNEEHPMKVFFWIKMTNGGILIFVRSEHLPKAHSPRY